MKKLIMLLLVVLTIGIAGCASNGDGDIGFSFSILYNNTEENPYQEDWSLLGVYEEKWNVTMDVRLGDNASYEEAIRLHLSTDSPPDVILKVWPDTVEEYVNNGLILPISDYLDLMPHFRAYIEDNELEEEIEKLRASNGKFYILPGYQRDLQVQQWIYRKDLFDDHDLLAPTTYDELYDSLIELEGLFPDSTPITASWGGAHLFSMIGANYGIPAGWSGTRYFDTDEETWKYAPATENYKEMYRFLNRLYENDLLDPETFSQTNDEFIEKLVGGNAFVTVTWISSGFDSWNSQLEENGITGADWTPLPVMNSTIGIAKLPAVNQFRKGIALSADSVNKPYFEDMIQFLDWAIYSKEGNDLTYWGIEGLTYNVTTDGYELFPMIISPKNPEGNIKLQEYGFISFFDLCENEEFENYKKPDEIVSFLENSYNSKDTLPISPELVLNDNAIEMIAIISDDLTPYVNDASMKFITGELSIDDDWDTYINELETLGYETLETIWNSAWQQQD